MKLVDDWKRILKRAWSIRLILLAGFFSGLEALIQVATLFIEELPIPRGLFAAISFIAANGAFVTRLIAQQNMKEDGQP